MAVLIILGLVRPQETVEPDGIEVLSPLSEQVMNYFRTNGPPHGRWGIIPQKLQTEGEWQYSPAFFSLNFISVYIIFPELSRNRSKDKNPKPISCSLRLSYKLNFRDNDRACDPAFSRIAQNYTIHDTESFQLQSPTSPSLFFFWLLFLKPADLLWN